MLDQSFTYRLSDGSRPEISVLTLSGPFTLGNMFELQNAIRSITPQLLIINLSAVPYMDSAGLGVLMNAFVSAQSHGRKVVLTGVNDRIRALFEMTRVDSLLTISDSLASAETML